MSADQTLPIRSPAATRTIGFSWRRGRYLSPTAIAFRHFIAADAAERNADQALAKTHRRTVADE